MKKRSRPIGWFGGLIALCLAAPSMAGSLEQGSRNGMRAAPRGEIRLAVRNGGRERELRYRYNADGLRIDRPGENIPAPPVNLLDFGQDTLRIIHPHNGTWEQGAIGGSDSPANIAGGIDNPALHTPESTIPATPRAPRISPPADWPEMPARPAGLPEGIGPGAAKTPSPAASIPGMPAGGMPAFPAMPAFPMEGMGGHEPMTLVSKNQTNELFGFSCRLYETAVLDRGTLSLWICDNPDLPPFYLLTDEIPNRHRRPEWDEQVAQLLRKGKMFPFRAVLRGEGSDVLAAWSVLSIKMDVAKKDQEDLLEIPAELHLLPSMEW